MYIITLVLSPPQAGLTRCRDVEEIAGITCERVFIEIGGSKNGLECSRKEGRDEKDASE